MRLGHGGMAGGIVAHTHGADSEVGRLRTVLLHRPGDVCGHAGGGPGGASSLLSRLSDGQTTVALASRLVPIEPVNIRLARPIG